MKKIIRNSIHIPLFYNAFRPQDDIKENHYRYSETYMGPLNLTGLWREESLCEYFAHVRLLKPVLTEEAKKILSATYLYHRSNPGRRPERTTVRLLDSLIRYNVSIIN